MMGLFVGYKLLDKGRKSLYVGITLFQSGIRCDLNYYQPILERSEAFLQKYNYQEEVEAFIEAGREEAEIYERFKDYYSYIFYIMKKQ